MSRARTVLVCMLSVPLVAMIGPTAVPAAAEEGAVAPLEPLETVIGDFESDAEGWQLDLGRGADGGFRRDDADADTGSFSGLLTADFGDDGESAQLKRDVDIDANQVVLRVRSTELSLLRFRVVDATGQTHQQSVPVGADPNWKTLKFTTLNGGQDYRHFGGANDGRWHGPARQVGLIAAKDDLVTSRTDGQIRFDAITMVAPDPRLSIGQTRLGNVFAKGQRTEFPVASTGDRVAWSVHDHWGNRVASGKKPVRGGIARLHLPVTEPGYYVLTVDAEARGRPLARAETVFAIVTEFDLGDVDESPFGVNAHFGQRWPADLVPLIATAGVKNVRDEMAWDEVEIVQGEYGFRGKIDAYLSELFDHDIRPFPVLNYTSPHYDNDSTPCTDAGRAGFAGYADAVLDEYADRISWVEVYNEFNHRAFGDRGDCTADARPEPYAELLAATYDRIKAEHPETTVVGGGTAGVPLTWLGAVFTNGGLEKSDEVSVHPYNFPNTPEAGAGQYDGLDRLIRQHNDGQPVPIWYSEIGWPTHTGSNGTSEYNQTAYLVRSLVLALGKGVERIFWHDFMNGGLDPAAIGGNYGIVRNVSDPLGRLAPKPSYVSYSVLTRQLTGAQYAGADDAGEGIHSHVFNKNGTDTRVMWSARTPRTVAVETGRALTVTELTGQTRTYQPRDGKVYLTVDGNPLYVRGAITGVVASERFALTAAGDGVVAPGEPVELTLTVDNTAASSAVTGLFEIAGERVWVAVRPGELAQIPVTVDGGDRAGHRDLIGTLYHGNRPGARLAVGIEVQS